VVSGNPWNSCLKRQLGLAVSFRRTDEIRRPSQNCCRYFARQPKQIPRPILGGDKPEDLILGHRVAAQYTLKPLHGCYRQSRHGRLKAGENFHVLNSPTNVGLT
jgi:hypothetical protein